ncbi:MAG: pantetheine-phosphate adenylyltransferase [Planctomycetota bacterium]
MTRALFPGSFDPPTLGHLDLVLRAAVLFDGVVVGVAAHPSKRSWLTLEERLELWGRLLADQPNTNAVAIDGLVVEAAAEHACGVLVRGVRSGGDLDDELPMAGTNRQMAPELDTVFLGSSPEYSHVRATLVRQIAQFGGDVGLLVPPLVAEHLATKRS